MIAKRVEAAARVIHAEMEQGKQTAGSFAAALESAQLLMSPETAAELEGLRARVAELEAQAAVVAEFVADRADYIVAIRNCHPDNDHDYDRWQGHAESRRQLAQKLGLPVAWPPKDAAAAADKLTRFFAPTQALREDGDRARCLTPHAFSPRDGWRTVCTECDHGKDAGCHQSGGGR